MAVISGLAMGTAAAMSGAAMGLSCSARPRGGRARDDLLWWLGAGAGAGAGGGQQPAQGGTGGLPAAAPAQAGPMMEDMPGGWLGFSMEEARAHADEEQRKAMLRTPKQVLADLQRGNARFWMNTATRPEKSAFERRALISKQFPSVAILGCADSRVPTEIVFDQGLGDLFVVRVAGNCISTATKASLQYAVHHLQVKVLLILGHEMCGMVKVALLPNYKLEQEPPELAQALKELKSGLNETALSHVQDSRAHDREAVTENVRTQVRKLTQDAGIMSKVKQRELIIVGAFYEISSGIVDFFFEVDAQALLGRNRTMTC